MIHCLVLGSNFSNYPFIHWNIEVKAQLSAMLYVQACNWSRENKYIGYDHH